MTEWQKNYVRFFLPVFKAASRISEAKLTSKSRENKSTERTKLVRPPPASRRNLQIGWALVPKLEVEIWRKPEK